MLGRRREPPINSGLVAQPLAASHRKLFAWQIERAGRENGRAHAIFDHPVGCYLSISLA